MFTWLKNRRRRRILAQPMPESWRQFLHKNVGWYALLTEPEKAKLERDLRVFLAEKHWEGCGGLKLTVEMQVTISGQACMLALAWTDYHFERVQTILVYPSAYRTKPNGADLDQPSIRSGEVLSGGPVVLSWRDSLVDARGARDGRNVVLHEFAHVLDMENGAVDGVPLLDSLDQERAFHAVIHKELDALRRAVDQRRPTLLDPYGASNPSEFFAVATEAFFELAPLVRQRHPELYRLLADYYQQDPAERILAANSGL